MSYRDGHSFAVSPDEKWVVYDDDGPDGLDDSEHIYRSPMPAKS
jgi:hypothetical protein